MTGQVLDRLQRGLFAGGNGIAQLRLDIGLDRIDFRLMHQPVVQKPGLEPGDGRAFAPFRDLGLVAVFLGVEHRMRSRAVGAALEELRPSPGAHGLDQTPRRRLDRHHVIAVHAFGVHPVTCGAGDKVGIGLHAGHGRSHGI